MKISKPLIAIAVAAALPLAAFAGDKDKVPATMGTANSAQFDKMDSNRDGRISQAEAAKDSRIVFATVDTNGDGYLDSKEYPQTDMSHETVPNSTDPATDTDKPR